MKYVPADKLIAEIKHLQDKFPVATYEALYRLITSLQQEQPEVDLEKEIDRFLSNATPIKKGVYEITRLGFKAVARHFYELGLKAQEE